MLAALFKISQSGSDCLVRALTFRAMDELSLAQEVAAIVADFRLGEIPQRTSTDVLKFVDDIQKICIEWMEEEQRILFLEGLRDSLNYQYWSGPKISNELALIVPAVRSSKPAVSWAILKMQERFSSQSKMIEQIESDDLQFYSVVPEGFDGVLYIDDATYTGRTLAKYLDIIYEQIKKMKARPSQLVVWHICDYSSEAVAALEISKSNLSNLGMTVLFHQVHQFVRRDNGGRSAAAMIPSKDYASLPIVQRFLKSSSTFQLISKSEKLWRNPNEEFDDRMFSSEECRDVVERAFLEVGCWLRLHTRNWNALMRPFGFVSHGSEPSLGFGSMFCTCFNSSNTSPVALWWGDPKASNSALSIWDPLLPRRAQ